MGYFAPFFVVVFDVKFVGSGPGAAFYVVSCRLHVVSINYMGKDKTKLSIQLLTHNLQLIQFVSILFSARAQIRRLRVMPLLFLTRSISA